MISQIFNIQVELLMFTFTLLLSIVPIIRSDLKSKGGQPPRIYGLGKVHKASIPVRPVLSMPGSPYYKIAAWVAKWLAGVPESNCQISSKKLLTS